MSAWELLQDPHRHYRYNGSWSIGPKGAKRRILSVTQVLDAADDRLQQWMLGQAFVAGERDGCAPGLMQRAYARGHGPEAIRDKAAALGTISHAALEAMSAGNWRGAKQEALERADAYQQARMQHAHDSFGQARRLQPVTTQDLWPRFRALEDFFTDHALVTEQSEVAVGSAKHAYAGTFDWFGRMNGVPTLIDAKNTNMLSWRHPVQLAGYELARREMQMRPAKRLLVLRLTAVATYEIADVAKLGGYAHARQTFLHQLKVFRAERRIDGLIDKHKKEHA
jgi:hypothetical protein